MLEIQQLIDRLTLGAAPGLAASIQTLGAAHWIDAQLHPGDEPSGLAADLQGIDAIRLDPSEILDRYHPPRGMRMDPDARRIFQMHRRELYRQSARARLLYAIGSPWQLRELLVDFWFNHFNIFAQKGLCSLWVGAFEQQAIRPHVLGRFEELLLASARHPAMLFYLDNWRNAAPGSPGGGKRGGGFNENYAREVMELHTVGLHYTQADVIGATRLLSGWGMDRQGRFRFFPRRHDFDPQTILGRRFAGGADAIEDFLRFLAAHPDTARHLAFEMAQYFVADQPPEDLVRAMAAGYARSGGDLREVTRTMIEHPAFAVGAAQRDKFRTPYRYVTALLRASGRHPDLPQPLIGSLYQLGQPLYGCVQPNGWPCTQGEWLSPDALTTRIDFAVALGGGWLRIDTRYARGDAVPMDAVADTLAASSSLRRAASAAPPRLQAAVLLGNPQMQYC